MANPYMPSQGGLVCLPEQFSRAWRRYREMDCYMRRARQGYRKIARVLSMPLSYSFWTMKALTPNENLCDILNWSIWSSQVAPQTVQEVPDALIQIWEVTPSHQELAQMLSGVHTGTWRPYTLLTNIMSCRGETHGSFSLWFSMWFWIQPSMGSWFSFPLTIVTSFRSQRITFLSKDFQIEYFKCDLNVPLTF